VEFSGILIEICNAAFRFSKRMPEQYHKEEKNSVLPNYVLLTIHVYFPVPFSTVEIKFFSDLGVISTYRLLFNFFTMGKL
jgi:hypothetical protein